MEDFGHALTVQPDDRAGRVAARPGDIRAQDDHVRVGAGFAGVAVRIGVTVAVALEQPGGGVVFVSGHISVGRRLVVDDDAVYILAALKSGLGKREGMRLGRFGIIRVHGAQVEPDVVRADVAAVAGAGEPIGVLADAVQIRIFQLFHAAVGLDPALHVVLVAPTLIAVEGEHTAPHLPQGAHRHARGANRTRAVGAIAHEQRQLARGAVRLNRHFVDQVGCGRAPMRQRRRVRVDGNERRAVFAGERLAGDGVHAFRYGVFLGHFQGDLARTVGFRRAELLGIAAG